MLVVLPPGVEEGELGVAEPVAASLTDHEPNDKLLGPEELLGSDGVLGSADPELGGDFEMLGPGVVLSDGAGTDGEADTGAVPGTVLDVPVLGKAVERPELPSEDVAAVRPLELRLAVLDNGEDSEDVLVLVELRLATGETGLVLAAVGDPVAGKDGSKERDESGPVEGYDGPEDGLEDGPPAPDEASELTGADDRGYEDDVGGSTDAEFSSTGEVDSAELESAELCGLGGSVDARMDELGLSEARPVLGASPLDTESGSLQPVGPVSLGKESLAGPVVSLTLLDSVETELTGKVANSVVVSSVI